jgi:hypothetical protein
MLEALVVLVVAFGLFVVLPLLLLKLLFGVVLFVVLLPFKILGALFHVLFELFWGLGKLALGGLGLLLGLLFFVLCAVLLPLLPFVLVGFFIYLLVKAFSPAPVPVRTV